MNGVYDDIITACKKALLTFDETEELLEYPEIQADKTYYLSILEKYNSLKILRDRTEELSKCTEEENTLLTLLKDADLEEKELLYAEIADLRAKSAHLAAVLSESLGEENASESVLCRMKFGKTAARIGITLRSLLKTCLIKSGIKITDEKESVFDGIITETEFTAEGKGVYNKLAVLSGRHKVYRNGYDADFISLGVTPSAIKPLPPEEKDLKIDIFHSGGAGGQNINKVETAVRITHIPTGTTVVCQDERSQIMNKRRALQTLTEKLAEKTNEAEKKRMEADFKKQLAKTNTELSFDAENGTFTDKRLNFCKNVPFPPDETYFASYINALTATRKNNEF